MYYYVHCGWRFTYRHHVHGVGERLRSRRSIEDIRLVFLKRKTAKRVVDLLFVFLGFLHIIVFQGAYKLPLCASHAAYKDDKLLR